jgi:Tol biopolymer transport system component
VARRRAARLRGTDRRKRRRPLRRELGRHRASSSYGHRQIEQPATVSRDGTKLLFTRYALRTGSDVYVMDANGGNVRRLTRAVGYDVAAGWSPDETRILLTSERSGPSQLFVMRRNGSRQRNISRNARNEYEPSWR